MVRGVVIAVDDAKTLVGFDFDLEFVLKFVLPGVDAGLTRGGGTHVVLSEEVQGSDM